MDLITSTLACVCRIAFGVVLAGMGPTAEPLIQILETANDVIMKLARAQHVEELSCCNHHCTLPCCLCKEHHSV